jgi:hypothetical protein
MGLRLNILTFAQAGALISPDIRALFREILRGEGLRASA